MNHTLKNFLLRPLLFSIYLSLFHPISGFAMDPKVAAEATEKIVSGVKNSLVLGERTNVVRASEGTSRNLRRSNSKLGDNLSISSSTSVRNSRTAVASISAASTMARNISSSSSSRLSARYNSTREAIQKKSGECRNEGAGITTSSSTSVRSSKTAVVPTLATSAMARNISSSSSSRLSARYDSTRETIQKKSEEFKIKEKTPQGFQVQVITEAKTSPVQAVEQIKIEKKATEYYQKAAEATVVRNDRLLSKLASADEVRGVDGAEKLSVQKLLDALSTGATKQFAAEVEFRKKSNDEEWQLKEAAKHIESRGSCLQSAAEALEKAAIATTQNNQQVATLWQKIASQYQEGAEYHRKSAEVVATGNPEEMGKLRNILNEHGFSFSSTYLSVQKSEAAKSLREMGRFCNIARQLRSSIYYLKSAIEALEKANIATIKGTQAVAAAWQQVAGARQNIAELHKKTIKGIEGGDDQDIDWQRYFEAEFEYEESSEKYAVERANQLEKEAPPTAFSL